MLRRLERREWRVFFDQVAVGFVGKRVEIEVASLAIGDQILASWLPLLGMTYDPKRDAIEIALEGLDHLVYEPRELYVEDPPFGCATLGVVDRDGGLQIVRLREPLMLAPPRAR